MTPEERRAAREIVLSGICPYCGAGPFRSPATHVYRAHGLTSQAMRAELGLDRTAVLVDQDLHEHLVETHKRVARENSAVRAALRRGQLARRAGGGVPLREQAREAMSAARSTPEARVRFRAVMDSVPHDVRSAGALSERHQAAALANLAKATAALDRDPDRRRELHQRAVRISGEKRSARARIELTCPVCGCTYTTIRSKQRPYCSHKCYATTVSGRWTPEFRERINAASREAKKTARKVATCVVCGREFWPGPSSRTTCSDECLAARGYDPATRKPARKPRFCTVCGLQLPPRTYRRTCSDECRHRAAVMAGGKRKA